MALLLRASRSVAFAPRPVVSSNPLTLLATQSRERGANAFSGRWVRAYKYAEPTMTGVDNLNSVYDSVSKSLSQL